MARLDKLTAAILVACLVATAIVNAQQERSGQAQQAGAQIGSGPEALDKNFLKQAAIDNLFEIQLSQLAQSKAQDQKVKQFAQTMVNDHTQATQQLKQVAQKKQVQLPTDLPEVKKEEIQIFQTLEGSEFDQAYLGCMKVAHAKDVAAFSNKAKHAKDPDVKQFAASILPKLQQHKQHVMAMTGGEDDDDDAARTAGARQGEGQRGGEGERDRSSGSSGTGSRETGSGTSTGGGTSGAGSKSP